LEKTPKASADCEDESPEKIEKKREKRRLDRFLDHPRREGEEKTAHVL